jgi:hypothetical protein
MPGKALEETVHSLFKIEPAYVAKAKAILGR